MNYQKYYSSQIHSSTLLSQLAQLWKTQTLCDAVIKTGNINTKAHRLVLVAACPMLQSMDNAAIGSHLEVRLAPDIKQDSVNMFLQFLYEGFMILTEENCKDIEKISRLLQVDSVIKCCADFFKSLQEKTGLAVYNAGQYKYTSYDMLEFRHMRVSSMQKSISETANKRSLPEFGQPGSPGGKRPRTQRIGSPSMEMHGDSYRSNFGADSWERGNRFGSQGPGLGRKAAQGGLEIVEDSIELVQTEPVERDPVTGRTIGGRAQQKAVSVSIASQVPNTAPELQIINVSGANSRSGPVANSSQITGSPRQPPDLPLPSHSHQDPSSNIHRPSSSSSASQHSLPSPRTEHQKQTLTDSHRSTHLSSSSDIDYNKVKGLESPSIASKQSKPYAVGSASQASPSCVPPPQPISSSTPSAVLPHPSATQDIADLVAFASSSTSQPTASSSHMDNVVNQEHQNKDINTSGRGKSPIIDLDKPDLSIVKIEAATKEETGGLEMYVDAADDSGMQHPGNEDMGEHFDGSDYDVEEPPGEMEGVSNDGSNMSADQSWFQSNLKDIVEEKESESPKQYLKYSEFLFVTFWREQGFDDNDLLDKHRLNDHLKLFYSSLRSKSGGIRKISTLNALKYRLAKYLKRKLNLDILWDPAFKSSNNAFKSILENLKRQGIGFSDPRPSISHEDLAQLYSPDNKVFDISNPCGLQRKVFFEVIFYLCRQLHSEGIRLLTKSNFAVALDSCGQEFVSFVETPGQEKHRFECNQGGAFRMYAQPGNPMCPVLSFKKYFSLLLQDCDIFWQRPKNNFACTDIIWYTGSRLGKNNLNTLMAEISKKGGLSQIYSNHSIRITPVNAIPIKDVHPVFLSSNISNVSGLVQPDSSNIIFVKFEH